MDKIEFSPIGIIYSPFKEKAGMPIQPVSGAGIKGKIEVFDKYVEGLKDIEEFSHIILLYHFHLSEKGYNLQTKPFLEDKKHGVFSIRGPRRPNPIGLSIVKLTSREKNILNIENLDILDGTPLFDIKPYIESFDTQKNVISGWTEKHKKKVKDKKSDARFGG
ncbi:MAG: tRNA (N6-threonylcarbamoyladenosine(37)-N6)-methyltransferase TrmO [Verrucomicrobiota bacterium]|nr:tRNA (N6-threonylcarbamoyladenosine(37)-N6)-methyltransferase TrmO [Verrucomicrobiota bacterium]